MNDRSPSVLRSALGLLSIRLVLLQMGVALAVAILFALWLHMPDASGFEVAGSAILALVVIAVGGAGESALMLRLAGRERTIGRLLRGTLLLAAAVTLWLVWSYFTGSQQAKDPLRAGYFNSQLPHALRYYFTYARISTWLDWTWTVLEWLGAGVLAMVVFAGTASTRAPRAFVRAARSATWWVVVVVGAILATTVTTKTMGWTPGHGLRREMLSLILRMSFVVLLDTVLVCLVLSVIGVLVGRADALDVATQSTPAGTPDDSQPRTAENP
jgi:hypothetical protein